MSALAALHVARAAEKAQALFYRTLAAAAEERGLEEVSERLNGLHADEQHHLSRLTARLVELGEAVADLSSAEPPEASLEGWERVARAREEDEIARYERLLEQALDPHTRAMIEEFIESERLHADQLGGKWMDA